MTTDVRIVGSRIPTAGVVDVRDQLLEIADRGPDCIGIFTAYFGVESFTFLRDLSAAGVRSVDVLLAANGSNRAAWEAAKAYALAATGSIRVRVARGHVGSILHPKLVIVDEPTTAGALIGSSNFSAGGLWGNVELNVYLTEDKPLATGSSVGVLHNVFRDAFGSSTAPSPAEWDRLIAAAPTRSPGTSGVRAPGNGWLPALGSPISVVGIPAATGPVAPPPALPATAPGAPTGATYNTLLLQLSAADVRRQPWDTAGAGTNQTNLPRGALATLAIPPGYAGQLDCVGVGLAVGTTETVPAGLWQRDPRGPGLLAEAVRLTFKRDAANFILDDIGPPHVGDVCVLEVPGAGLSTANPIRLAIVPEAAARLSGMIPTANRRGTHAGRALFWEVRPGTVL